MNLRHFLYIDGSNLYNAQFELFGPSKYMNFNCFIRQIEVFTGNFERIFFYCSYSRGFNDLEKKYVVSETLFYNSAKNTDKLVFFKGYRSKRSGKEKLVDVKLSVDMVSMVYKGLCDNVCLLSGDADFLAALGAVRDFGIEPTILCMQNRIMREGLFEFQSKIIRIDKTYTFRPRNRLDIFNTYIDLKPKDLTRNI